MFRPFHLGAALAAIGNAHAVVTKLVAPVLTGKRPDVVLVVDANLFGATLPARLDDLLLLDDFLLQAALFTLQNFVLDLDDALDELRQLLGQPDEAAPGQIAPR